MENKKKVNNLILMCFFHFCYILQDYEQDDDAMLQAALQASLQESG